MPKRTWQPKSLPRKRKLGFRKRQSIAKAFGNRRNVLRRRRLKGRHRLTPVN